MSRVSCSGGIRVKSSVSIIIGIRVVMITDQLGCKYCCQLRSQSCWTAFERELPMSGPRDVVDFNDITGI